VLRDIRELADEPDAYAAELRRRRAGTDRLPGVSSHMMLAARGQAGPFRIRSYPFRAVERQ
jgi:hypothetical protein